MVIGDTSCLLVLPHLCEHFSDEERHDENEGRNANDAVELVRDGCFGADVEEHRRYQGYQHLLQHA